MPLPELIEIIPLTDPQPAQVTVPGSKSITNRALILAALAQGETKLTGALWSEDTQVMAEALEKLGFSIRIEPEPEEPCNRTITVRGLGGEIPKAGTETQPLELFVGNAGTAARFLAALVCLGRGVYRLHGIGRMHERPQAALFEALRSLSYQIDATNDRLPAVIHGVGPKSGFCRVSIEESSQFASALLLCARVGQWELETTGHDAEEAPYVAMTQAMIEAFPSNGGHFQIEPDASSASYFVAAGWLARNPGIRLKYSAGMELQIRKAVMAQLVHSLEQKRNEPVIVVRDFPTSKWQIDSDFPIFIPLPRRISRHSDLGDSIMTAITLAALVWYPVKFTDLERLRLQECERVTAMRTELTKCGAKVVEEGETLTISPGPLHGAEIETYNDHRMAMCFAILGLIVPGIKIHNPACVKKTFPNFFQKLAAPPPSGLGVTIKNTATGRVLAVEELFAE